MTEFARRTCRVAIPFVLGGLSFVDAADYHIHPDGRDDAPGTIEKPWKTVDRANRQELKPGDRLLFAGWKIFEGGLVLDAKDAGMPEKPVVVGSYGTGRAILTAGLGTAVLIRDAGGVEVRDLVCIGEDRTKNHGCGVAFVNNEFYGALVTGYWDEKATRYANADLLVAGCRFYKNTGDPDYRENHSGSGILVYTNTFITDQPAHGLVNVHGKGVGVAFRNNLLVTRGAPLVNIDQDSDKIVFQGNLYWSEGGAFRTSGKAKADGLDAWRRLGKEMLDGKPVGLFADPRLNLAAARGTAEDMNTTSGRGSAFAPRASADKPAPPLMRFLPAAGSPAVDAGLDLKALFKIDAGRRDFQGRKVPAGGAADIGACERN